MNENNNVTAELNTEIVTEESAELDAVTVATVAVVSAVAVYASYRLWKFGREKVLEYAMRQSELANPPAEEDVVAEIN